MANYTSFIEYNESNVRAQIPGLGGVYRIGVEVPTDKSKVTVVYVGMSDDLERRLLEHLSDQEPNACLKKKIKDGNVWVSWATIGRESDRDTEESAQISQFHPECNDQKNT